MGQERGRRLAAPAAATAAAAPLAIAAAAPPAPGAAAGRPAAARGRRQWRRAALALVCCLGLALLGGARAQSQCASAAATPVARFGAAITGQPQVTTVTLAGVTVTSRQYCFQVTNNAAKVAASSDCSGSGGSPCCSSSIQLASIALPTDNACYADKRDVPTLKKVVWTLDNKQVPATFSAKLGGFRVTMPKGWAAPTGRLCFTTSESDSFSVRENPCATIEKLCGSQGCKVGFKPAGGAGAGASTGAKAGSASCCVRDAQLPFSCPAGSGVITPGAGCEACPPGTYQNITEPVLGFVPTCMVCPAGEVASSPGSSQCAPCPAGQVPNAARTACSPYCEPGTGGVGCAVCERGTWSWGGSDDVPVPGCAPCKAGYTTPARGATSPGACTVSICPAGSGGDPCQTCPYGSYSPGGTRLDPKPACVGCPTFQFTSRMGATSSGECVSPAAVTCPAGSFFADNACHACPLNTYLDVAGGTDCISCPQGTITLNMGSTKPSDCVVSLKNSDIAGTMSWTTLSPTAGQLTQTCRADLLALFSSAQWDGYVADRIKNAPDSCRAADDGFKTMLVIWNSKIMLPRASGVFQADTPGLAPLNWAAMGYTSVDDLFGKGDITVLPSGWTDVGDLNALYAASFASTMRRGPLIVSVMQMNPDERFKALSLVNAALAAKESAAYQKFGGKMSQAGTYSWMVARGLKDQITDLIPALRPESPRSENITLIPLGANSTAGRKLLASTGTLTLFKVPMTDANGDPRNLICGAGVNKDGTMAPRMAINAWAYQYCDDWPPANLDTQITDTSYVNIANDAEVGMAVSASIQIEIPLFFGISITGSIAIQVEKFDADNTVTLNLIGSKMMAPPTFMPDTAPPMTAESLAYLRANSLDSFYARYGTHFVVGYQQGGSLSFTYTLKANEFINKIGIQISLGLSLLDFITVTVGGGFTSDKRGKTVNIQQRVWTDSNLPAEECATAAVNENFDPIQARACVAAWTGLPGAKAYNAWSIPYLYHPDFQAVLLAKGYYNGRKLRKLLQSSSSDIEPDYRFKETGILQVRLNAIKRSLDKYQFKDDTFFYTAQKSVERAQTSIDALLTALRNGTLATFAPWHALYVDALGLVEDASSKAVLTPQASRCGWCKTFSVDDRSGGCTSNCSSTLDCKLSCPGQADQQCLKYGYTYRSDVNAYGVSIPKCSTSVTGEVCSAFGQQDTSSDGSYHCKKLVCKWRTEYCDADVERDEFGKWACLGNCVSRTAKVDRPDGCTCDTSTATGEVPPDSTTSTFCFFGDTMRTDMWSPPSWYAALNGTAWQDRASFNSVYGSDVSLYRSDTDAGYDNARSSFLTHNCATPKAIQIMVPDPVTQVPVMTPHYLNSCACRKADFAWVSYPQPKSTTTG